MLAFNFGVFINVFWRLKKAIKLEILFIFKLRLDTDGHDHGFVGRDIL